MKGPSVHKKLKKIPQKNVMILLVLVIASSFLLILINYFTIKTLSAVRAYTSGESRYSKGQRDASRYLILYIGTKDSSYWALFEKELSVPIGDSLARVALSAGGDEQLIKQGFLAGRNHKDDLDDMIWLFKNFHMVSFMKNAIQIWKAGDQTVGKLRTLALAVKRKIINNTLTPQEQANTIAEINTITNILTKSERAFLDTLGSAGRRINSYLFFFNIIMTFLIIGSTTTYASAMIKRLRLNNQELLRTNQELDKFVYSASHDLRSPITSVKGLIALTREEKDLERVRQYLDMMNQSLDKQDQFIKDIIDFSKNKRDDILLEEISLNAIINDAIIANHYNHEHKYINIQKEANVDTIIGDVLRYKIIFNNLISNALKYFDPLKESKVFIKTSATENVLNIEVTDNGIGIRNEDLKRIFEMFFVGQANKGSGLGLYVTQQTVHKLRGTINVESSVGIGSKFTVSIPLYYATII